MIFYPLASGSTGNACLIVENDTAILIDAGIGPRIMAKRMLPFGIGLADLSACFLTHEHSDHVHALSTVTFPKTLPLVSNIATWEAVCQQIPQAEEHPFRQLATQAVISIGDLTLQSLPTSHDGVESVGYLVYGKNGESLLFVTDLGVPSSWLPEALKIADHVVLEANHDIEMLKTGPYPWFLKQRVAGELGHLSNLQTGMILSENLTSRTQSLVLAHLSRTNNRPELAVRTVREMLATSNTNLEHLRIMAALP